MPCALQELRYLATVVRMQRLFRRQLARRRQWERLLDVMHTVLDGVRATRCAFDTWAEGLWEAQSAASTEAISRSKRWAAAAVPRLLLGLAGCMLASQRQDVLRGAVSAVPVSAAYVH